MMMMKSFLSGPFLLLFLLSSTASGSVLSKYYQYIYTYSTWQEAQSYCRSHYTDLATIYTQSDKAQMYMDSYSAFIGLYKTGWNNWNSNWNWYWYSNQNSSQTWNWVWSDGQDNNYNYQTWAEYEPNWSDRCAIVHHSSKRFYGTSCEEIHFFICHKPKGGNNWDYIFIPEPKNWSEAQQYCRTNYRDLASIKDDPDMNEAVKSQDFPVWTGLHRDGGTWKWSTGVSEYRDWASNVPGSNGDCVSILSVDKKMATQNCSALFPFICISDNLILVKENKTWEEALEHCRNLEPTHSVYDLVSVEPVDHEYMIQKIMEANTEKVWTGLRFLAGHWVWVNGAPMLYPDLPPCPIKEQRCGVLSQNDKGSIETTDCLERRNFLCYRSYA